MATAWCEIIQSPIKGSPPAIPLVLIHDGGGTTFQYYLLQSLGRRVYGISNPYFDNDDEDAPKGGVPELARSYVQALRAKIRRGRVILGGWSFGGMISLEMSRLLQHDRSISVAGLLMFDSVCPWNDLSRLATLCSPCYREATKEAVKAKVDRSFEAAYKMISSWQCPPSFEAPPAIMIRARESLVDLDYMLGWGSYECLKFKFVIDVDGDHFSMFGDHRMARLTASTKHACALLSQ